MPTELGMWLELGALGLACVVAVVGFMKKRSREAGRELPIPPAAGAESPYSPPGTPPPLPDEVMAAEADEGPLEPFNRVRCRWVRRWDFLVIGLVLCLYLWPVVLTILGKTPDEPPKIELATIVATMVMQLFFSAVIIGLVVWRIKPVRWLGLNWPGRAGIEWVKWLVAVPVAIGATWMLLTALYLSGFIQWVQSVEGSDGQQEVVRAFQEINDPLTLAALILMAVVVAPVTEELIFRGYLYPVAKSRIGRNAAVIVSAVVFAAVHHNAVALPALTLLALMLAVSFEFSGSIWMPMSIHAAFNGLTVIGQLAIKFGYATPPTS
ncbi:CPBP family intramembrane glutamic endopeptidase [Haloferula sargassicola]|uniref:CAAX prenyl protease 2/Lysostaphin resistance protein A-like domain-containing protein n=1 Tax=Haloferula sargassicola TaxID=490096 RepID=A0ABP9UVT2_9BACT